MSGMNDYKKGDKVLVEGKIVNIDDDKEPKYLIETNWGENKWAYEYEVHTMLAKDEKTYEDGLHDAWEMACRIISPPEEGGLTHDELKEIFGVDDGMNAIMKFPADEAIKNIRDWEEKAVIHVGDVVKVEEKAISSFGRKAVVTAVCGYWCYVLFSDGEAEEIETIKLVKTGNRIEIIETLKQMEGEIK